MFTQEEINYLRQFIQTIRRSIRILPTLIRIEQSQALGARVYRSTTQSINTALSTAVSFDTEDNDTDDCWDVSAPTRLTVKHQGYYRMGGQVSFTTGGTSVYRLTIAIRKNGTIVLASDSKGTGINTLYYLEVSTGKVWMNEGDYIEIMTTQESGGALNINAADASNQQYNHGWIERAA